MAAELRIRDKIISKIEAIPETHLEEVLKYLEMVERKTRRDFIMSFAGSWKDMDEDFLENLTTNLPENRVKSSRPTL